PWRSRRGGRPSGSPPLRRRARASDLRRRERHPAHPHRTPPPRVTGSRTDRCSRSLGAMSSSPAWLDALTPRGGPLVSAARRFLETHAGAPPSPDARGAEGLRTLAKAVDAWAERDDEPTDAD